MADKASLLSILLKRSNLSKAIVKEGWTVKRLDLSKGCEDMLNVVLTSVRAVTGAAQST